MSEQARETTRYANAFAAFDGRIWMNAADPLWKGGGISGRLPNQN